jgi:hypothetical protein
MPKPQPWHRCGRSEHAAVHALQLQASAEHGLVDKDSVATSPYSSFCVQEFVEEQGAARLCTCTQGGAGAWSQQQSGKMALLAHRDVKTLCAACTAPMRPLLGSFDWKATSGMLTVGLCGYYGCC